MYKAPSFGLGMKKDLRESIESVYDINNTINEEEQLIISLFEEFLKENFHVEMLTEEDIDYIIENEFPQWLEEQEKRSFIGRVLDYFPGYPSTRKELKRKAGQSVSQNLQDFAREIPNTLLAATPAGRAATVLRSAAPAVTKAVQKSAKRVATSGSKKGPSQASQASKSTKETGEGNLPIFLKKMQQPQMQGSGQQAVQLGPPPVPKPTSGKPSSLMSRIKTSQEIEAAQKAARNVSQKAARNVSQKAARNVSQKPPKLPPDTAAYAAARNAAQKAARKTVEKSYGPNELIASLEKLPPRSSSVPKILKKPSAEASATKVPANAAKASATKASATAAATTRNLLPRIPQTPEPEPESNQQNIKKSQRQTGKNLAPDQKGGEVSPQIKRSGVPPLPVRNTSKAMQNHYRNISTFGPKYSNVLNYPAEPPVGYTLLNPINMKFTGDHEIQIPRTSSDFIKGIQNALGKTDSKGRGVQLPERKPVPTPGQINRRKVRTVAVTPSGELLPQRNQERNQERIPGQNSDSGALTNTNPNGGARTPVVKKRKLSVRRKSQPTRSSVDRVMKNTGAPAPPFKGGNTATFTDDGKPVFKSDTIPKRDALRRKSRRPSTRRSPSKTGTGLPEWAKKAFTSET